MWRRIMQILYLLVGFMDKLFSCKLKVKSEKMTDSLFDSTLFNLAIIIAVPY